MRSTAPAWLVIVALASCQSCEKKAAVSQLSVPPAPPVTGPTAQTFWSWFAASEADLAVSLLETDPARAMAAITERAQTINKGFIVELGLDRTGGPQTLVISAGGDPTLFDAVRAFVAAAPPLAKFKVVAFRPRRQGDQEITVGATTYKLADFFYRETGRSEGKLDLEILYKGLTAENNQEVMNTALVLLDAAVGEYDAQTKLGDVTLGVLPAVTPEGLKPLTQVTAAVDSL